MTLAVSQESLFHLFNHQQGAALTVPTERMALLGPLAGSRCRPVHAGPPAPAALVLPTRSLALLGGDLQPAPSQRGSPASPQTPGSLLLCTGAQHISPLTPQPPPLPPGVSAPHHGSASLHIGTSSS